MRSKLLLTIIGTLAVVLGCAFVPTLRAQTTPMFTPDLERAVRLPAGVWYKWGGGALLGVDQSMYGATPAPLLYRIDRDGRREEIWFEIPGATLQRVRAVAGGDDGAIAVCGSAYSGSDSRFGTYVAWISPDRKRQTAARVWPYVAGEIAIAPDGTIWSVGYAKDLANTKVVANNVLVHLANSGQPLGSRRVSAKARLANQEATLNSFLVASPDRLGWLTNGGEYIEFSFGGKEIGRFKGPAGMVFDKLDREAPKICGFTLSPDNQALMCVDQNDASQVLALDRQSGTWRAALPQQNGYAQLVGFDGGGPVVLPRIGDLGVIRNYKQNPASPAH